METNVTPPTITREKFDAVLFDLDGVLTATARLHARCWKKLFDAFLQRHADQTGATFEPFDIGADYKHYVDGKPRYDGVQSFLEARGIELPWGDPQRPPDWESVCGLGNHKEILVRQALAEEGVEAFPGSVAWVRQLRGEGFRTGVVSSSSNCAAVLSAAGIADLFEVRVDGKVAAETGLPGKPAPDTFLEAARQLGVEPARAVVVEDAISGVQAGKSGGFGLVIGVAREDNAATLEQNGAGLVVGDLQELVR